MSEDSQPYLGSKEVRLGCGTLILITLIVWFFTAGSASDVERGLRSQGGQLDRIESKLDAMQESLERLEKK